MQRVHFTVIWLFYIKWVIAAIFLTGLWFIGIGILTIIASNSLGVIDLTTLMPILYLIGWILFIIYIVFGFVHSYLSYQMLGYEVQQNGLYIERGVFFRKKLLIDYATIKDITISIHPLNYRMLGIVTFSFGYTEPQEDGGNKAFQMHIPGMTTESAEELKGNLMQLSHVQTQSFNQPYRGVKIPT